MNEKEYSGNKQNRGLYKVKFIAPIWEKEGIKLNCAAEHLCWMKENTFKVPQLVHGTQLQDITD